jgi:uncharacterized membrane protein YebE (DUF533 family)
MEARRGCRYHHGMNNEKLTRLRRQLRNIVVMAVADGSLNEREVNLIADRCLELGLDEFDLQKAIEHSLAEEAALELPHDAAERRTLMHDLIHMMAADGRLEESEKRLFALAAARMDMSVESVEQLIDEALQR